jgi:pilus assembly protein CpaD
MTMSNTIRESQGRAKKYAAKALLLASALALSACSGNSKENTGFVADTYKERHPIVVGPHQTKMDVYVDDAYGSIHPATIADIQRLGGQYLTRGHGSIVVSVPRQAMAVAAGSSATETKTSVSKDKAPTGKKVAKASVSSTSPEDVSMARAADIVRKSLQDVGVHPSAISIQAYSPMSPIQGRIIMVSMMQTGAYVASRCGQWPDDLGVSSPNLQNRNYHNFGCATQKNLAAQIANPMDLVTPRKETPIYAPNRKVAVGKYATDGNKGGETTSISGSSQ